ncbi:MAG: glycosyltransferase family 2 protein [Microgenomates group bacterium]
MQQIDLSIIIISYNTKKITLNCLKSIIQSLKNTKITYEIIVVDNNSNDGSQKEILNFKVKNKKTNMKLIFNKDNIGFGKANNQAVKIAKGEYLLFLNSDIVVLNNSIEKMFKFYKQYQNLFNFLGGKLLNKDKSPQPSCGPMYFLPMVFAHLFLKGDYWQLTRFSPKKLKEVDWVSGACFITKKEYFNKINGFDENIFMYMDEVDLFYRAKKNGYRIFFYPEAKFIHLGSASSGKRTYPILQVYKGLLYFYKKHRNQTENVILKFMLKLKAKISIFIGYLTKNQYLIETYEKAYQLVKMAG